MDSTFCIGKEPEAACWISPIRAKCVSVDKGQHRGHRFPRRFAHALGQSLKGLDTNMQKIMIVDDSPSMRRLLSTFLEQAGYSVSSAVDGVNALEVVSSDEFDLIITDINMPNMDGLTLVAELRKLEPTRLTPILILTTEMDMSKKQAAKESGATGWLNKPFDEERTLAAIQRVLE